MKKHNLILVLKAKFIHNIIILRITVTKTSLNRHN